MFYETTFFLHSLMLYLIGVLDKKNECLLATLNQTLRVLETHIYNLVQIVQALTLSNIGRQEKRANMS